MLVASALLVSGAATLGCASRDASPDPALGRLWSDYRAMPDHRALAIAGDLRRSRWVAGAAGGLTTRAEAESAALRECGERRALRRMVAPCRLYAIGDELVRGR